MDWNTFINFLYLDNIWNDLIKVFCLFYISSTTSFYVTVSYIKIKFFNVKYTKTKLNLLTC